MPRFLKRLGTLVAASASCILAYLAAAFLVGELPDLLLASTTDIRFTGLESHWRFPPTFPQFGTELPPNPSALLYAADQAGSLLAGLVVLALGLMVVRRAQGWARLFFTQTVFWTTVLLVVLSGLLGGWRSGLRRALAALWPAAAGSRYLPLLVGGALALLALLAAYACTRHLLDAAGSTRLGRVAAMVQWLLLPSLLATTLVIAYVFSWRALWQPRFALLLLLWVLAHGLVVGLPAAVRASRPAQPLRLSLAGGTTLLIAFALTSGTVIAQADLVRYWHRQEGTEVRSEHWRLHFDPSALARVQPTSAAAAADRRAEEQAGRLGLEAPPAGLRAFYYASPEAKLQVAGDDEPYTVDTRRAEVHDLLASTGDAVDARGDALLLMQAAWGQPGSEAVAEALARYAVGDFHGHTLPEYAARIAREEKPYALREILRLDSEYLSPLVRDALSGAWVQAQVERRGSAVLLVLYRAPLAAEKEEDFARRLGASWGELESDWQRRLAAWAEQIPPAAPRAVSPLPFQRGISFSHEVGGRWGYGSERAGEELERIRALGANAVAVVPYAFTRAPAEPVSFFDTDETDARLIRTIEQAHQLGLRVMLKPQLWSREFTGKIHFTDGAEFERWFASYRRWLLHFARLAELYQVDLVVIGTELGGVTSRETAWRALIADLHRIYPGPLTYAANWDGEFETIRFWDALDYIGVNFYFPLAAPGETPRADSARVQELTEKFAALARARGKPVLFTEVGYPSTASAGALPWEEEGALDNEAQRRCYETVFAAFYRQPWLAGLYWWKWPSHGRGSLYATTYNPVGKPALDVIARWYQASDTRNDFSGNQNGSKLIQQGRRGK